MRSHWRQRQRSAPVREEDARPLASQKRRVDGGAETKRLSELGYTTRGTTTGGCDKRGGGGVKKENQASEVTRTDTKLRSSDGTLTSEAMGANTLPRGRDGA